MKKFGRFTFAIFLILVLFIIGYWVDTCWAEQYYVYIDKIGYVAEGEEAGHNAYGDVVGISPFTPQYKPTRAELSRYKIMVVDLTEQERTELLEPELKVFEEEVNRNYVKKEWEEFTKDGFPQAPLNYDGEYWFEDEPQVTNIEVDFQKIIKKSDHDIMVNTLEYGDYVTLPTDITEEMESKGNYVFGDKIWVRGKVKRYSVIGLAKIKRVVRARKRKIDISKLSNIKQEEVVSDKAKVLKELSIKPALIIDIQ